MPDRPNLPTVDELKKLPLRAIVAYAARCAFRVEPLVRLAADVLGFAPFHAGVAWALKLAQEFTYGYSENVCAVYYCHQRDVEWTQASMRDIANQDAEHSRTVAAGRDQLLDAIVEAETAETDAVRAAANRAAAAAARSAASAAEAARAAYAAYETKRASDAEAAAVAAADAGEAAAEAISAGAVAAGRTTLGTAANAARSDYLRLLEFDLGTYPKLGEEIDIGESGPLGLVWPDGTPEWLTALQARMTELKSSGSFDRPALLDVFIAPGEGSKEDIQAVLERLSDLQVAAGGLGLEFNVGGLLATVGAEVPA